MGRWVMAVTDVNHTECFSKYNCLRLLIILSFVITGWVGIFAQKTITVDWPFTIDNTTLSEYTYTSTIFRYAPSGFTVSASYSSEITPKATSQAADGLGNSLNPPFTEFYIITADGSDENNKAITFNITPTIGDSRYKLKPTGFSLDAYRDGTDGGCIEIYLRKGSGTEILIAALYGSSYDGTSYSVPTGKLYRLNPSQDTDGKYTTPDYVSDSLTYNAFSSTSISDYFSDEVSNEETLSLVIKPKGFNSGGAKTLGLRNITLTCELDYSDTYAPLYEEKETAGEKVSHKAAKWYQENIREQGDYDFVDTFDDENRMDTLENDVEVQATHIYVDTIYMKKGTSIDLLIPGVKYDGSSCAINNYFRWFNYRNDKNFYFGDGQSVESGDNRTDLLIPVKVSDYDIIAWRFANGYVSGLLARPYGTTDINGNTEDSQTKTLRKVSFYYPTDTEFDEVKNNLGQSDNKYYSVACDLSNYTDFSNSTYVANAGGNDFELTDDATYADTPKPQIYCEPTLMQRVLFYIIGIDESTSKNDLPEDFQYYGNLFDEAYQGGMNGEGKKYLEEYEITFPSKRISDHTDELVALSKDAQSYALPGESDPTTTNLNIAFAEDEDNGLTLSPTTITGANRVIQFYKGTSGSQWSVANNSKATILVTKTVNNKTYNIARYKLTFKDACVPLTEPQIAVLDTLKNDSLYWWGNMKYRSKSYMNENYDLVNSLWFDYGTYATDSYNAHTIFKTASENSSDNWPGQYQNYPFPLKWNNSSYAFYDGSYDVNYYNSSRTKSPLDSNEDYRNQTSFCMYEIVNDYVGFGELNSGITPRMPKYSTVRNSEGSWLYIDASDRPGTVVELDLNEKLCQGSEVIATAWMKSSGYNPSNGTPEDDAAVMFTIMGVRVDEATGKETHTPIYRQNSGQIRTTNLLVNNETDENGETLPQNVSGKGSGTNEWFQLYMSFVNKEDNDYDYYTVRIDNCCASTNGGDYYLDEISVYVVHPAVDVAQIEPVCTSDDTKGYAPIRLDIDYESLMGCFGLDSSDYNSEVEESDDDGDGLNQVSKRRANEEITELDDVPDPDDTETNDSIESIDFIIINKYKYEKYLASSTETDSVKAVKYAIENSIDTLYYRVKTTSKDDEGNEVETDSIVGTAYPTLNFYLKYLKNVEYDEETTGENYPVDSLIYRRTDSSSGLELLSADFYSDISAYTPYMIVLKLASVGEKDEKKLDAFASLLATSYKCAVKSDFSVTSTTKIRVNGEVSDPSETLCKNQVVHIEPQGTYTTTEENEDGEDVEVTHKIEGEYFDWFVGLVEEYVAENEDYGGESLESALSSYRLIYPDESSLASEYSTYENDTLNVDGSEENNIQFTEDQYDLLQSYLVSGKLALHSQYLDVHVSDSGLVLVIQPIPISDYKVEDENTMICFGYVPLVLMIDGQSPTLNMGFRDVSYPSDFTPALRLGLEQLKKATKVAKEEDTEGDSTDSEDEDYTPITVNLRDASYVVEETEDDGEDGDEQEGDDSEEEEEQQVVDHLGRIDDIAEDDSVNYAKLYLVGTNDTDYVKIIEADNFGSYELEVGEILRLYANENSKESDKDESAPTNSEGEGIGSYMQIYFYDHFGDSINGDKFVPKEGCYYSMTVHFEEKDADGKTIPSPCYGSFPLILKVVPEYLVWQGTKGTENWNDDNNWRRADKSELKKSEDDAYPTNEENKTNGGYVPMLFTKVVMPKDSKAELYMAGFAEDETAAIDDNVDDGTSPTKWAWTNEDEKKPTNIYPIGNNIMYDMMVYEESKANDENTKLLTTKPYRVNLCDEIHLETGAQLQHAELLMYNKMWMDIAIKKSEWNLMAMPLKDVYVGDWYTKTSGEETAEYFTDIDFSEDNGNSRYNPLVYQRSWNSDSATIYSKSDTTKVQSYALTGWSSVYNDASVELVPGSGFSVKAYINKSSNDSIEFRFPKNDDHYNTANGLSRTDAGRLWLSDMVSREITEPEGDGKITYAELDTLKMTKTYPTVEGFCLVGNPFTASMSMAKFLDVNKDCISSYWFEDKDEDKEGTDGPIAGNGTSTSDGASDKLLPAYSAFFVQVDENLVDSLKKNGLTVMFTQDMQSDTLVTIEDAEVMSIRAANANGMTSAAFGYSDKATDTYSAREDAILLEDDSWKRSGMPLVYTVAGDKAVSVNTLKSLNVIPLGVFADEGSSYTLTFVGVNNVEEPVLYDAELNTETPLTEGYTMTLEGATHGRYFIRTAGNSTEIQEVTQEMPKVVVYSPTSRTIVVSADEEIERVEVYDIGGRMLKRASACGNACTIGDINTSVAIVKVFTSNGTCVSKLRIKN
ncbi:MAG: hypothetical protein LUD48_02995 [Prevotella sp.]|nr:hypothetical protein [Prevotella sp.]